MTDYFAGLKSARTAPPLPTVPVGDDSLVVLCLAKPANTPDPSISAPPTSNPSENADCFISQSAPPSDVLDLKHSSTFFAPPWKVPGGKRSGNEAGKMDLALSFRDLTPLSLGNHPVDMSKFAGKFADKIVEVDRLDLIDVIELRSLIGEVNWFVGATNRRYSENITMINSKLDAIALAVSMLERSIGGNNTEIEKATGYTTVYDGLLGLHRELELFRCKGVEIISRFSAIQNARLETLESRVREMQIATKDLKESSDYIKSSLELSMGTLCDHILPGLIRMKEEFYEDPGQSLAQRVQSLEKVPAPLALGGTSLFGSVDTSKLVVIQNCEEQKGILARIEGLKKENASLKQEIAELESRVTTQQEGTVPLPPLILDSLSSLQERLANWELNTQKGKVSVAGCEFGGVQDCKRFLHTRMDLDGSSVWFVGHDVVSLVNCVTKEGKASAIDDVLARDHHAIRGGFDNMLMASVYASMRKAIPIPLAGTSSRHSLPRISSFEKWDRQYGRQGIQFEISQGVDQEVSKTIGWLIRPMSPHHQDALAVLTALTMEARNHWLAIANFLTSQRTICLRQCEDAEEAWRFPCKVIKAVFVELHRVWSMGLMRPSLKKLSIHDAAEMMWGILRCHKLMNKFVSHKFLGHPKLLIFSLNHLSRLKVSLKDLQPMKQQADQLQLEMGAMLEELNKKEDKLGDNDVV